MMRAAGLGGASCVWSFDFRRPATDVCRHWALFKPDRKLPPRHLGVSEIAFPFQNLSALDCSRAAGARGASVSIAPSIVFSESEAPVPRLRLHALDPAREVRRRRSSAAVLRIGARGRHDLGEAKRLRDVAGAERIGYVSLASFACRKRTGVLCPCVRRRRATSTALMSGTEIHEPHPSSRVGVA